MNNVWIYLKSILIPILLGSLIGLITSDQMMIFETLNKPPLSPPAFLFPIVWTILYLLMGISYGRLKSKGLVDENINKVYYIQLILNALWPIFFFVFNWRLFSFVWIIALIISVIAMIKEFYSKDKISGILQIPYLIWLFFAAYLNISIYLLN